MVRMFSEAQNGKTKQNNKKKIVSVFATGTKRIAQFFSVVQRKLLQMYYFVYICILVHDIYVAAVDDYVIWRTTTPLGCMIDYWYIS